MNLTVLEKIRKAMLRPSEISPRHLGPMRGPAVVVKNPSDAAINKARKKWGDDAVRQFEESSVLDAADNAREYLLNNPADAYYLRYGEFSPEMYRRWAERNLDNTEGYTYPRIRREDLKKLGE